MSDDEEDFTLYEINFYDEEGKFLHRRSCVPPFDRAPWVIVAGERYFVLMDDMTYHEAIGVHFTDPLPKEEKRADPKPKRR